MTLKSRLGVRVINHPGNEFMHCLYISASVPLPMALYKYVYDMINDIAEIYSLGNVFFAAGSMDISYYG